MNRFFASTIQKIIQQREELPPEQVGVLPVRRAVKVNYDAKCSTVSKNLLLFFVLPPLFFLLIKSSTLISVPAPAPDAGI